MRKPWVRRLALFGSVGVVVGTTVATGMSVAAASSGAFRAQHVTTVKHITVKPHHDSMMDCNGHSPKYKSVKAMGSLCADPLGFYHGKASRFRDNGVYVGHDEPSVKFISGEPGSGNNMSYVMQLAKDPAAHPTINRNGAIVSDYAELSPAPWFGLPICDGNSYPQNPCTPDSDSNSGEISNPNDAGSAFLELQFYAPGYAPFVDGPSCTKDKWCVAVTIDSLSCTFGFATCNNNCIEPTNFAFLQTNGVPAGPPGPQLTNINTFTPNAHTLEMNGGDQLVVSIHDTSNGLFTGVTDLNSGQTGYMVASGANGFMNTSMADCSGTPFNFHPEYSTAAQQNQVPWAAAEGGVLMEDEIGHFEPCSSVTNSLPFTDNGNGGTFSDTQFQTCNGGFEGKGGVGEGPCDPNTGVCNNASTEGDLACPSNNFASGFLCEYSDASCFPKGSRTITTNGVNSTTTWPIAGCEANFFQNGDLDYDGSSYVADWPDGSANHPTSFQYIGPFTNGLDTYPQVQYETDGVDSEANCDTSTGAGCTVPPLGPGDAPTFYPFWSLSHGCQWNFGNDIAGQTAQDFGQDAQYGSPDLARFGGTSISAVLSNPQLSCVPSIGKRVHQMLVHNS
jgi:hypothetical protein